MELQILHLIQGLRSEWLDDVMVFITKLGDEGEIIHEDKWGNMVFRIKWYDLRGAEELRMQ